MIVAMIRRCPRCGHGNHQYAYMCHNCKDSVVNVQPEEENGEAFPASTDNGNTDGINQARVLKPTDLLADRSACLEYDGAPDFKFSVKNGDVAGRGGMVDLGLLPNSNFISREHVRFVWLTGAWYLETLAKTNKTYINGKEIAPGSSHRLVDGDRVTLANTGFIFKEVG